MRFYRKPEFRISALYVLLASIWIIGSDMVVESMDDGRPDSILIHSTKGLNFVLTTGVLLYFVLRKSYGGWRKSEERRFENLKSARERYRKLSTHVQNLREQERTRIAREIHDELGQLLTGVKMQLRLIENQLGNRNDRSLNSTLDSLIECSATIDESIASVKRISSGLRPAVLDHLGLAAALDEEADAFSRRTGIPVELKIGNMDDPIPPEIETTAFRIFQESLTNVARHAKAKSVTPECSIDAGVLTLRVRDDGVGIEPEAFTKAESFGLVGMLERAADAGGKIDFKSSSTKGTEVVLTIPISHHPELFRAS